MILTSEWNDERHCFTVAELEDYWVDVIPMIFNHRVVLTPKANPECYDVGWCYPDAMTALTALAVWDPFAQAEPLGYIKRVGDLVTP